VEWVETTGRTLEEAKDAALDQLGVHEDDAEFEVVEEPKSGLFGLTRREARVRARVRPTVPRPKVERRDRRRRATGSGGRSSGKGERSRGGRSSAPTADKGEDGAEPAPSKAARNTPGKSRSRTKATAATSATANDSTTTSSSDDVTQAEEAPMTNDDVTVQEQATIISAFVEGLLDAYGLAGEITSEQIDDETIEIQVNGPDLGLLIGPKGQTLAAIQDLGRTVVQRKATGTHHGRVRLDVSGYRQRRREALERFATTVAEDVKSSRVQRALEPMNAADRKVVHDTVNEIGGVSTVSEGEDQRRRVVIIPDA
jgi:spoIIIJ-associated protein